MMYPNPTRSNAAKAYIPSRQGGQKIGYSVSRSNNGGAQRLYNSSANKKNRNILELSVTAPSNNISLLNYPSPKTPGIMCPDIEGSQRSRPPVPLKSPKRNADKKNPLDQAKSSDVEAEKRTCDFHDLSPDSQDIRKQIDELYELDYKDQCVDNKSDEVILNKNPTESEHQKRFKKIFKKPFKDIIKEFPEPPCTEHAAKSSHVGPELIIPPRSSSKLKDPGKNGGHLLKLINNYFLKYDMLKVKEAH